MKNSRNLQEFGLRRSLWIFTQKIPLVMKLFIFYLFCSIGVLQAVESYAQHTRLSLTVEKETVANILRQIEDASDFDFFYNNSHVDLDRRVSVSAKDCNIFSILDNIFKGTKVHYTVLDKKIILSTELDSFTSNIVQQDSIVKGKVIDIKGEPIIGATIKSIESNNGTTTDINGNFSLIIKPNSTIEISFIGYKTQIIKPTTQENIQITLKEDTEILDEVVIIGYGSQKKVNLTGAVSAINIDEKIASRSLSNVSSSLSGLIPGLQVMQSTSMAGKDGASLKIRGLGTVNNSDPLIVVDGMPDIDINRINMADIESISVLKDAASSSIYGSRAANGVILITTKSGKSGKTSINFNASYAFENPSRSYDFMTDYARTLTLEQQLSANGNKKENFIFKDGTIDQWMAMSMIDPLRFPNTDWFDLIMRKGSLQNYTISATGGNEKSNFYTSIGIIDKEGFQIHNDYTRYNIRLNYDYKMFNKVNIGVRFDGNWSDFTYSGKEEGFTEENSSNGDIMAFAIPGVLPYDPSTGRYGGVMAYGEDILASNPYALFQNKVPKQTAQQMNGNIFLDWEITKGLKAHIDYSLSYNHSFKKTADIPTGKAYNFQTGEDIGVYYVADDAIIGNDEATNYKTQLNARINYEKNITPNHYINALFVYSEEFWHAQTLGAFRNDRIHPSTGEIDAALTNVLGNSGNSSSEALRSYIGRFTYNAYEKYLLEFNFRVDGSSKFAKGHRYGFFPSIAAGWRFSEENFIRQFLPTWITSGKFRLSYGSTGNNSGVGRFEQMEMLSIMNYMAEDIVKGFVNKKMINKDLTWEISTIFNLGVDLRFFDNRLITEFDYYHRLTSGMNRPSQMSIHLTGAYTPPRANIGDMKNEGLEVNLTWQDKIREIDYSINLNGAYNKTTLKKWNEFLSRGWVFLDMPYHFLYTYENAGIAQNWQDIYNHAPQGLIPGDVIRKDLNGDGIIDNKDKKAYPHIQRDRPTTTLGLTLKAAWKNFDIMTLFNASLGRKDYWITSYNNTNFPNRRYAATWDHWTETWSLENRNGQWPRIGSVSDRNDNNYWLYSMDYIRLKNLQLGYNLPKKWLTRLSISNMRLYFSAENLFTLTKYPGLDPDKPNSSRDLYPINKSYSIGINISI